MEQYGNQNIKKKQNGENFETCPLHVAIPAKSLIPVRTF